MVAHPNMFLTHAFQTHHQCLKWAHFLSSLELADHNNIWSVMNFLFGLKNPLIHFSNRVFKKQLVKLYHTPSHLRPSTSNSLRGLSNVMPNYVGLSVCHILSVTHQENIALPKRSIIIHIFSPNDVCNKARQETQHYRELILGFPLAIICILKKFSNHL